MGITERTAEEERRELLALRAENARLRKIVAGLGMSAGLTAAEAKAAVDDAEASLALARRIDHTRAEVERLRGTKVDDVVDRWHASDGRVALHDVLGLTPEQYAAWMSPAWEIHNAVIDAMLRLADRLGTDTVAASMAHRDGTAPLTPETAADLVYEAHRASEVREVAAERARCTDAVRTRAQFFREDESRYGDAVAEEFERFAANILAPSAETDGAL